jgi:hypothetical protein
MPPRRHDRLVIASTPGGLSDVRLASTEIGHRERQYATPFGGSHVASGFTGVHFLSTL